MSIGSNDLIQYVLAVDRQDELVSHLFDPSSRAVIEMLDRVVRGARRAGRPVQICGELAGDPDYAALLLGLGIREFSLPPGQLSAVKSLLIRARAAEAREIVTKYLDDPGWSSGEELLAALERVRR